MLVLETKISRVRRDRDFGQIEARVTLFAKIQAGRPAHPISVLTHVPARGDRPLRERLIEDAIFLARHLKSRPTVGQRRTAA
ncbi:hypothetical protein [Oceaniglobus roseus]|uniref:hypothetical protein n=1 Tax=Oceaniglobus roseus TaxID=1737570 RepID=UPI000C7ECD40|nr:hypothetical protein [Kandeliimicrobium roseum]